MATPQEPLFWTQQASCWVPKRVVMEHHKSKLLDTHFLQMSRTESLFSSRRASSSRPLLEFTSVCWNLEKAIIWRKAPKNTFLHLEAPPEMWSLPPGLWKMVSQLYIYIYIYIYMYIYIYIYIYHKDIQRSCESPLTSALRIRWWSTSQGDYALLSLFIFLLIAQTTTHRCTQTCR